MGGFSTGWEDWAYMNSQSKAFALTRHSLAPLSLSLQLQAPQGIQELLDTKKRRQLDEQIRRSPQVQRSSPSMNNLPTPCTTPTSSSASTISLPAARTSSPGGASSTPPHGANPSNLEEGRVRTGNVDMNASRHPLDSRDCKIKSGECVPPSTLHQAVGQPIISSTPSSVQTPPISQSASSSSSSSSPSLSTRQLPPLSQSPFQRSSQTAQTAPSTQENDSKMAPPSTNGALDGVYGNIGNTQQQIQQLLRHQQQMLGSQSILHTHMQYYQVKGPRNGSTWLYLLRREPLTLMISVQCNLIFILPTY